MGDIINIPGYGGGKGTPEPKPPQAPQTNPDSVVTGGDKSPEELKQAPQAQPKPAGAVTGGPESVIKKAKEEAKRAEEEKRKKKAEEARKLRIDGFCSLIKSSGTTLEAAFLQLRADDFVDPCVRGAVLFIRELLRQEFDVRLQSKFLLSKKDVANAGLDKAKKDFASYWAEMAAAARVK